MAGNSSVLQGVLRNVLWSTHDTALALLPLQIVGTRGEAFTLQASARTTSNNRNFARTRQYIGNADVSEIRLVFSNYYVGDGGEFDGPSTQTVRFNVECNGQSVRGYFNGHRERTLQPGDAFVQSDPILPASFGLEVFPKGAEIWIRAERDIPAGQGTIFHKSEAYPTPVPGERFLQGGVATTTANQLDATGYPEAVGGWSGVTHVWLPLCIIGRPVTPMMAVGTVGASIEAGVDDEGGDGTADTNGGGYIRRTLLNLGGKKIAGINLAKGGETAKTFVASNAKRLVALKYVNHAFAGHGGNDYATGQTAATTMSRLRTTWSLLKGVGIKHVEQITLHPKTNSTDGWATTENQTPRWGFNIGGEWFTGANDAIAAEVATDPNLDGFLDPRPSQVDATRQDVWRTDLGLPTIDGTHPKRAIHAAMAAYSVAHFEALRANHELSA